MNYIYMIVYLFLQYKENKVNKKSLLDFSNYVLYLHPQKHIKREYYMCFSISWRGSSDGPDFSEIEDFEKKSRILELDTKS